MGIVVQKYGGTSLSNVGQIRSVAEKIKKRTERGDVLIVVVSARAGATNDLCSIAKSLADRPDSSCLDALMCVGECETAALLSIVLNGIGVPAVSRNAYQVGILTCSTFGNAKIKNISGGDIGDCIMAGMVVVVPGFQGVDENMQPTTLGRGGSDLTAIALAHKFNADFCEIYTDVDGVFNGDPRIIDKPTMVETISHDALLRLSFFDNKIMQDRSVALAKKMGINFSISSSLREDSSAGTLVVSDTPLDENRVVWLTYKTDLALISVMSKANIFNELLVFFAQNRISLNFVKHSRPSSAYGFVDEIAVSASDYRLLQNLRPDIIFAHEICACENLTRIDIVGAELEYSQWLGDILAFVGTQEIFRSEYVKNGLSFLVRSDVYVNVLNRIHGIIHADQ
jgi:aspartate kinase